MRTLYDVTGTDKFIIRGFRDFQPDADSRPYDNLSYLPRAPVFGVHWSVWYKYLPLFAVNKKEKQITGFFLRCATVLMKTLLSWTCDILDCPDAELASWFVFIVLREIIQCFLWQSFQRFERQRAMQSGCSDIISLNHLRRKMKWST